MAACSVHSDAHLAASYPWSAVTGEGRMTMLLLLLPLLLMTLMLMMIVMVMMLNHSFSSASLGGQKSVRVSPS